MKKKVRNLMLLSLLAGTIAMTSCKNSEGDKDEASAPMQNEMHQGEDKMEPYKGEELQAEFKEEGTAKMYKQYIAIKDALVNTDAEATKKEAADLAKDETSGEIVAAAEKIAASDNVNKQREAFSELTKAMETELEAALASGEIYKQYCPMAFEGQGDYWFSNSKDIYNPYFGNKMLNCGRVDATIK